MHLYGGSDEYESYNAARTAAYTLAQKIGEQVLVMDAEESSLAELQSNLSNIGLFSNSKIIFLRRAFNNKAFVEYLESTNAPLTNLIVWQPGKVDKRTKFAKELKKQNKITEFTLPKPWDMTKWLVTKLPSGYGSKARSVAAEMIGLLGVDKWTLASQVDKLVLYQEATGNLPSDISKFMNDNAAGSIWEFLDLLRAGKSAEARQELSRLYRAETNEQYILAMLSREIGLIRDLLMQKQAPAQKLDLHPFVVKKVSQSLHRFSLAKMEKLSGALLRLDMAIKTGRVNPQVGITLYTLSW